MPDAMSLLIRAFKMINTS